MNSFQKQMNDARVALSLLSFWAKLLNNTIWSPHCPCFAKTPPPALGQFFKGRKNGAPSPIRNVVGYPRLKAILRVKKGVDT